MATSEHKKDLRQLSEAYNTVRLHEGRGKLKAAQKTGSAAADAWKKIKGPLGRIFGKKPAPLPKPKATVPLTPANTKRPAGYAKAMRDEKTRGTGSAYEARKLSREDLKRMMTAPAGPPAPPKLKRKPRTPEPEYYGPHGSNRYVSPADEAKSLAAIRAGKPFHPGRGPKPRPFGTSALERAKKPPVGKKPQGKKTPESDEEYDEYHPGYGKVSHHNFKPGDIVEAGPFRDGEEDHLEVVLAIDGDVVNTIPIADNAYGNKYGGRGGLDIELIRPLGDWEPDSREQFNPMEFPSDES